jgi:monofunctional biosynthetic peptidoglycan transglycosylase
VELPPPGPQPPGSPPPGLAPPGLARRALRFAARALEVAAIAVALGALGLLCSVPRTARLADENPTSTAFIDLRRAEAEAAGRPFQLQWQWRRLTTISRYLRAAVIYAEDYNFYRHDGIDWRAIEHAVTADWNKGAMAVGGSTITQQLAKNLYLSPHRSFVRKLREALIAFSLEDHLGKQRILELYLNVVEWGDGVFGAEAAAHHWFHHAAQTLTPAEAIRLAIALPNPITRAPNVRDAELTKKGVRLARMFRMQGLIDAAQERVALDELGARNEHVLPDREVPALVAPTGPPATATHDAPAPPSAGQPASPDEPASTGAVPAGPNTAPPVTADPAPAPSRPSPPEPQAPAGGSAEPAADHGSDR